MKKVRRMKLLNIDQNAKTVKGQKQGYLTGILYLAPANLSGYEVCPGRSKGCTADCLYYAGRGAFKKVQAARVSKTKWFHEDRKGFVELLNREISSLFFKSSKKDLIPCVRLNGTSDIDWEAFHQTKYSLIQNNPLIQFYDYTKRLDRKTSYNYHLTFSLSETNEKLAVKALDKGWNVAVVFKDKLPETYQIGKRVLPVIDGDLNDLRFLDPKCVVVGLKAKGRARKDTSGFVKEHI
jgi:hypothetical protein